MRRASCLRSALTCCLLPRSRDERHGSRDFSGSTSTNSLVAVFWSHQYHHSGNLRLSTHLGKDADIARLPHDARQQGNLGGEDPASDLY